MVRILSLVENTVNKAGLLGEHGLAMWIDTGGCRVLFDTGQGMALQPNARALQVPLERADAVVLSHGHYDHTGGLAQALGRAHMAKVYAHPDVFRPRFGRGPAGRPRQIGMGEADRAAVRSSGTELIETTQPTEVVPGLFATGPVPRTEANERTSGPFFLDSGCRRPDPLMDDQAVFLDAADGLIVLLGCAHAGVVNTLSYVRQLTNGKSIQAVIGGMHLRGASKLRIEATLEAIQQMGVAQLRPAHCTGMRATARACLAFPEPFGTWSVGETADFP